MANQHKSTSVSKIACGAVLVLSLINSATDTNAQSFFADKNTEIDYLKGLSLEDLLQTEIFSVSKKSEQLFDTTSAVFVITQEDLRRTGARNIPEALRMVPGLQVASIDANHWAITSRGFADWFSNKLLVMIDGRSVYTPAFSGVHWNVQNIIMSDIERIEVIRGPGATVWGANAVNGVINIITKNASETLGKMVNVAFGSHEQPLVEARYGTKIADSINLRLFAKGVEREPFNTNDGDQANDNFRNRQAGFQASWRTGSRNDFVVDGRIYDGEGGIKLYLPGTPTPPYMRISEDSETFSGGHLLSSWTHRWSTTSELTLQAYYDIARQNQVVFDEKRYTFDVEIKHHWDPEGNHDLVWGAGYRWIDDKIEGAYGARIEPENSTDKLLSVFVQDDIMLLADRLWLTLGAKFEDNDYTGFEIQPSARARFKFMNDHLLWAAISRAVRTPSRSERGLSYNTGAAFLPTGNVAVVRMRGDKDFDSEFLNAYEAGYRWQPQTGFSMELAAFFNDYTQLRNATFTPGSWELDPPPGHLLIIDQINNELAGRTYGFEALVTWRPSDIWRLSASYAWLELDLHKTGIAYDGKTPKEQGTAPNHQIQLRSYLDLPWNLHFDTELYYVSKLDSLNTDAYTRIDMRLEWTPSPQLTLSAGAENLLSDGHQEFLDGAGIASTEVPRTFYGQLTLNF